MMKELYKELEDKMKKSIAALDEELCKQRAGRASPNLLDGVMVDYYGNMTPMNQVASVTVESALMIVVKPWEKKLIGAIEKAILKSDLGLNPSNNGDAIRVPLPALTEERRKELIKVVKADAESARISIRNLRRDANAKAREALKDKLVTEDDARVAEDKIQKLTDSYVAQVDKLLAAKEKDLMEF